MVSPGWANSIEGHYYEVEGPEWFTYFEGPRFSMLMQKVEFTFPDYVKIKKGMILKDKKTEYLVIRKYRNKVWAIPSLPKVNDTCP